MSDENQSSSSIDQETLDKVEALATESSEDSSFEEGASVDVSDEVDDAQEAAERAVEVKGEVLVSDAGGARDNMDAAVEEKKQKWVDIQTKAFVHWINSYLGRVDRSIDSITDGFHDGVNLVLFLEQLTGRTIGEDKWTRKPRFRVHWINNCFIALKFLQNDMAVDNLTISAEDIVDGKNIPLLLGFCWLLLRKQFTPLSSNNQAVGDFEAQLLAWVNETLEPVPDIEVHSFEDLYDGRALVALMGQYDPTYVDASQYDNSDPASRANYALNVAQENINIPADIIDVDELVKGKISDKNLVLYLTLLNNAFNDKLINSSKESLQSNAEDAEAALEKETEELDALKAELQILRAEEESLKIQISEATDLKEKMAEKQEDKTQDWLKEKENLEAKLTELKTNMQVLSSDGGDKTSTLEARNKELEQEIAELEANKTELTEKNKSLKADYRSISEALESATNSLKEFRAQHTKTQHDIGTKLATLTKLTTQHLQDIYSWEVFLKQDTEYLASEQRKTLGTACEELAYEDSIAYINKKTKRVNAKLEDLLNEKVQEEKKLSEQQAEEEAEREAAIARSKAKRKKRKHRKNRD